MNEHIEKVSIKSNVPAITCNKCEFICTGKQQLNRHIIQCCANIIWWENVPENIACNDTASSENFETVQCVIKRFQLSNHIKHIK